NLAAQPFHTSFGEFLSKRSGSGKNRSESWQFIIVDYRALCEGQNNWGNNMGQANLIILRGLQKGFEFETRHHYDRSAGVEAHVENHDEPVDMKQRQHADQSVSVVEVIQPLHLS